MNPCPSVEDLRRLLAETLPQQERTPLEAHVEGCPPCQQTLEKLTEEPLFPEAVGPGAIPATMEGPRLKVDTPPQAAGPRVLERRGLPPAAQADSVGGCIGPYRLLQKLGEGGMGVVWVAEQHQPVKRRVALKVIKPGMDSAAVVHRFEAERQALALMDHPSIAKILDAGTTTEGRPYFVMELVPGVPMTKYCDQVNLSIRERLELFVPVCRAVQHAHQKGIIHRDLKPSNILVCMQDGKPLPKVIDFGVAKALHQRLTEATVYTEIGAIIGTLEYMSPEQAEMSPLGVDTRTDIYALGVLLYELLTGSTPFDRKRLRNAGYSEVVRIIKEEEPARPSTRLTQSKETLTGLAAMRRTEPARLRKELRGELDWITLKCLEKDRTRRYETASDLAEDVEHYLTDRPVRAGPARTSYLVWKFVRRNKALVLGAGSALVLLVAGIIGTTWGLIQAEQARWEESRQRAIAQRQELEAVAAREAESEQRRLAQDKERQAVTEKRIAEAVKTFLLQDLLRQADLMERARTVPREAERNQNPTVRELLDRAAAELTPAKIDRRFPGQREVQASILQTVGSTYTGVGASDRALEFHRRAVDAYRAALGDDHPRTAEALYLLAKTLERCNKIAETIPLYEQARAIQIKHFGADASETITTMSDLGSAYRHLGRHAEAIAVLEQMRDLRIQRLGLDNDQTLNTLSMLALAYRDAGRRQDAIPILEQVCDLQRKKKGADHQFTLGAMNNLALSYKDCGRTAEAVALLEQVLAAQKKRYPADHPEVLNALQGLAETHEAAGNLERALALYQETAAAVVRGNFVYRFHGIVVRRLSGCLEKLNRFEEAETWRRRLVEVTRTRDGVQALSHGLALAGLGQNLLLQQKLTEAESVLRSALAIQQTQQPDAALTHQTQFLLGTALLRQQNHAAAEPLLRQGYDGLKKLGSQLPALDQGWVGEARERLAQLYESWGKPAEAAQWRREGEMK